MKTAVSCGTAYLYTKEFYDEKDIFFVGHAISINWNCFFTNKDSQLP
jgi:hypothetical protein